MTLEYLGLLPPYQDELLTQVEDQNHLARVIQEHKELYVVQNQEGVYRVEVTGNLRYSAESRKDFPAVGDWVAINIFDGESAIIYKVLSRFSQLERQAVGMQGEKQLIATNIDYTFIVQGLDRDFNLNRLERYFVIAHSGKIQPIVVLNKADLLNDEEVKNIKSEIKVRLKDPQIFVTSTIDGSGLEELKEHIQAGKTYCLLGSSGVGKSSIINYLSEDKLLKVNEISESTNKGKHTTTHRELIVLENGGILIDTPGMREVGITDGTSGLELTFSDIEALAKECRFSNCSHIDEPGCKVLEAIEEGTLSFEELDNFKKLERQAERFSATVAEKRKKDKSFGKMAKEIMKYKKKHKY